MQWGGEWRLYQPKALSSDTRWTTDSATRQEVHTLPYSSLETEVGGIERRRPSARQQSVRYNHGPIGGTLLENRAFKEPIEDASGSNDFNWRPTSLTTFEQQTGGAGSVSIEGEVVTNDPSGPPLAYIDQKGGSITGGADAVLKYGIDRDIVPPEASVLNADHYLYYLIQVGSYFWDNAAKQWTTTAAYNEEVFTNVSQLDASTGLIETAPLDDGGAAISGQLTVRLYGIFSKVSDSTGVDPWSVRYRTVDIVRDVVGATEDETLARLFTVGVQNVFAGEVLDEVLLLSGDGPTSLHRSRLTVQGDETTSWKIGAYDGAEAASGVALGQHWAQQSVQMSRPAPQRFEETWYLAGSTALTPFYTVERGGIPTHWERLTLDFRDDAMSGLWVQMQPVDETLDTSFAEEKIRQETGVVERRDAGTIVFSGGGDSGTGSGLPDAGAKGNILVSDDTQFIQVPRGLDGTFLLSDDSTTSGLAYHYAVESFNTRTGDVTLTAGDVTGALGYTPPPDSRVIGTTGGLSGGGNLTANRTLELAGEIRSFREFLETTPAAGLIRKTTTGFETQDVDLNNISNANLQNSTIGINASNPQGQASLLINGILDGNQTVALGNTISVSIADDVLTTGDAVTSFNGRQGVVTLQASDVTTALGFTPPPDTRQINTTDGLTGGGTLELNRTLGLTGEILGFQQFVETLDGQSEGVVRRQGGGYVLQDVDLTDIPNSSLENSSIDILAGSGVKINTIDGGQATVALGGTLNLDVSDDVARAGDLYTSSDFDTDFSGKTTDDLAEGSSNLYHTSSRVRSALSGGDGIALDASGFIDLEGESLGWHQFLEGPQAGNDGFIRRQGGGFAIEEVDFNNISNSQLVNDSITLDASNPLGSARLLIGGILDGTQSVALGNTIEISINDDVLTSGNAVTSFEGRTGSVTLQAADVTGALGFSPVPETRQVNTTDGLGGGGSLTQNRTLGLVGEILGFQQFVETLDGQSEGFIRRQGGGYVLQTVETSDVTQEDLVDGVTVTEDTLTGETNLSALTVTLTRSDAADFVGSVNLQHTHDASDVTGGTFAAARIPNLSASKITSGTLGTARIPNLSAGKITSGTFSKARIPTLSTGDVDFTDQNVGTGASVAFNKVTVNDEGTSSAVSGVFGITSTVTQFTATDLSGTADYDHVQIGGRVDGHQVSGLKFVTRSTGGLTSGARFIMLGDDLGDELRLYTSGFTPSHSMTWKGNNVFVPSGDLDVSGTASANVMTVAQTAQSGGEVPRYDQIIDAGLLPSGEGFVKQRSDGTYTIATPDTGDVEQDDLIDGVTVTADTSGTNIGTLQVTLNRSSAADFLDGVNLTHDHDATDITAGTLAKARIPTLSVGDVDFANQSLNTSSSPTFDNLDLAGDLNVDRDVTVNNSDFRRFHIIRSSDSLEMTARGIIGRENGTLTTFLNTNNNIWDFQTGDVWIRNDLDVQGLLTADTIEVAQAADTAAEVPRYDQIIDTNNLFGEGFVKRTSQGGFEIDTSDPLTQSEADDRYLSWQATSTDVLNINGYIRIRQDGVNYYVATVDPFAST
jgi:hypothetical protein